MKLSSRKNNTFFFDCQFKVPLRDSRIPTILAAFVEVVDGFSRLPIPCRQGWRLLRNGDDQGKKCW